MKPARRIAVQPWRDPRLLLGILLVLVATVVGAKVFAAQDDTQAFWMVKSAATAGDRIGHDDLVQTRIQVARSVADHYVRVDQEFPADLDDLVWAHDVEAGALLERAAVVPADARPAAEVPLSVANGSFPADLARGDRVDVWVGPAQGRPADEDSTRVLRGVRVLSPGGDDDVIGGAVARTVLVGAGVEDLDRSMLSQISSGHVTLVRVP